ncbi:NAD(P)-dependent oxidoreductase [Flavobacterium antarcticum]|uniref:NAD(P)-dependent oxidoreductase n=1 Tax=Flavobacterium antarcticum TaxID=271155 RepID=UPI0003B4323C|nr:NAD(P)-dependent oxidoreductase [Flavobacterium antarcticum]
MKVLANDGISANGIQLLEQNGFEVITTKVAQEQVAAYINKNEIDVLFVRTATKISTELLDDCPSLKVIGIAEEAIDNKIIDYAKSKGKTIVNASDSSAVAMAELVFAHLFSGARFLHDANRNMPLEGDSNFNSLKKAYSSGIELRGKTLGIIGFTASGIEVAKIGLALGMHVIVADGSTEETEIELNFYNGKSVIVKVEKVELNQLLRHSDFITIHLPASEKKYLISEPEFKLMKDNVGIVNVSQGGIINEVALLKALDDNKVLFAGLDVFEEQPTPAVQVLMHPKVSLTPHIGSTTVETQQRMEIELVQKVAQLLK